MGGLNAIIDDLKARVAMLEARMAKVEKAPKAETPKAPYTYTDAKPAGSA